MNWNFLQGEELSPKGGLVAKLAGGIFALYLAISMALSWWWDTEPPLFDVLNNATKIATRNNQNIVTGYTTAITLHQLADTLLNKRGGYLSNDVFPPGAWLDNIPNWEFGVLVQIRDMARAMRVDFSRSQSQSSEDTDLSEAEGKFFFDNASWLLPQSEDEYHDGQKHLETYLARLSDPDNTNAQFYARADNLRNWLTGVETRLGSLSQRLSQSVGKRQLNIDLMGDSAATQATSTPQEEEIKTSWTQLDNIFYEARGQTWALIHLLSAIDQDFADVLDKKNARIGLRQIVRELESTQDTVWSPVILNGSGMGFVANHSLVMASHISRANAALSDLRQLLEQG
ncbi:MAG: DUF2333 family protein [Pseudomonadales bacterium]|nr:DUF2333 family protein [Pseudomonadales bacterium]